MNHGKLVRDRIPEIIKAKKQAPITRIAGSEEYFQKLKEKLLEETSEFLEAESKSELADIIEVINAICDFKKIPIEELEKARKKKAEERGAFKKRIILEKVE